MEKMLDLFKEPVEIQDLPNAKPLVMAKGDVVFGKRRATSARVRSIVEQKRLTYLVH